VTSRIGYDVTGFPLDGPVPAPPPDASSRTFSHVLYETARRENMTLRDLYNLTAAARGHWVLCGTPKRIADTLRNGLSRKPRTVSTFFPLTSLAHWSTSSTWSCRSFRPRIVSERVRGNDVA
jgi:alkanesulfonate monooxygenase SsuD/methylene tetrahydromethanopterin reductase-like flavin-dependent oxidoreductase (luciferase family)